MSCASAIAMRRALQFCHWGVSRKCLSAPAATYSAHFCQFLTSPPTVVNFPFRQFSDAPTSLKVQQCENQSTLTSMTSPKTQISKRKHAFIAKLALCSSPSDVLDMTSQSPPPHLPLSHCLSEMWNILKKLSEGQKSMELQLMRQHPGWEPLLQHVLDEVSHMSNTDLAHTLYSLNKLGVDSKKLVIQTYLRAAQDRITGFNVLSLSILSGSLDNMEECANVRALKHAIRLLMEDRVHEIEKVFPFNNIVRIMGKDAPPALKQKLETKALSMSDQLSPPKAHHMIRSMAAINLRSEPLLRICTHKLTEQMSSMPFNSLMRVLESCCELDYKDLKFLTALSEHGAAMVHVWSHRHLVFLLSSMENLSFSPVAMLDSYSKLLQSDPGALTLIQLLGLLRVCFRQDYHSPSLLSYLSSELEQYIPMMSAVHLLNATLRLSMMGHFSPALLQALLQKNTLQQLHNTKFRLDLLRLCVRLQCPELEGMFSGITIQCSEPFRPRSTPKEFSSALQSLMKGRQDWSVTEGLALEGYHYVDALLTKNPCERDEESSAEERSHSVAVLCFPEFAFCFGTSHPKGHYALDLRHLRILGHLPVLVTKKELVSLSKEQRVHFLQERIFPTERPHISAPTQEEP